MQLDLFEWVYIITGVFGTYTIYRFMQIFFSDEDVNRTREFLSYAGYYLIITFLFLVVKIPVVLIIANLILFFCLTCNYHASMVQRVVSVILIFMITLCLESIIVLMTEHISFSIVDESAYRSIFGLLIIKVIMYMAALIMDNFTSIKNGVKLPGIYWLCVVLIPISSLYLLLVIFSKEVAEIHLLVSMSVVLFLNFAIFYLYDHLAKVYEENTDKKLIKEQNRYYEKQLSMMKSSLDSIRALKHDMKNHFASIASLAKQYDNEELLRYLKDISRILDPGTQFSNTGNTALDSVLNFKLQEAKRCGANIASEIAVPSQLKIKAFDLTTILGNLLDNAINGIMTIEEGRRIGVYVSGDLNELTIIVKNTFDGKLKKSGKQLVTRQQNKSDHGYGTENIKRSVRKYHGVFEHESENDEFIASITLFPA